MVSCDFVIPYDPKVDTNRDILKRILNTLILKRLKGNKPAVTFISGDSGEGKSISTLHLTYLLCQLQGMSDEEFINQIDTMNVYTPLQYPSKLDKILFNKEYKKTRFIVVHEAREVVKASNWQGFINTAISDVNAMSRSIKPIGFFMVAQFIRDIDPKVRYTLNYYVKVSRPYRKKARLYFYKIWKDDRDLDKPKIRKRKIVGWLVYPNGRRVKFSPQYIELGKPPKEFIKVFEKQDRESKVKIIRHKLDKLMSEMSKDMEIGNKKLSTMVEYYVKHPESLKYIGKQRNGTWRTVSEFKKMHDLTPSETSIFEEKLNEKLIEKKLIEPPKEKT